MRNDPVEESPSPNYKTIDSEERTRNPTTNKRINDQFSPQEHMQPLLQRPHRLARVSERPELSRKHQSFSLTQEISTLEQQRKYFITKGQFKKAQIVEERLRGTKSELARVSLSRMRSSHSKERQSMTKAHHQEMKHFRRVWGEYFDALKQDEEKSISKFKRLQQKDIARAQERLKHKCHSLRQKSIEVICLEKREKSLIKEGKYQDLEHIRHLKKQISERIMGQREGQLARWIDVEEKQLNVFHTKRYNTLMSKLSESRQDKERAYYREQKRLKQKYRNVLRQLEHEQKMELYSFLGHADVALP